MRYLRRYLPEFLPRKPLTLAALDDISSEPDRDRTSSDPLP
ncbi:hypothetical protein Q0601_21930 [Paracoccus onubensis]|nr:hypothetical protein [Paracoccus onubensis]MDP0929853.1 hypothetical protein [Paracoccus onubensis]